MFKNTVEYKHKIKAPICNIELHKIDNFFKMEVNGNITLGKYFEKMSEIDEYDMARLVRISNFWDGKSRLINQGIYYVLSIDGKLYNILINGEYLKICQTSDDGKDIIKDKVLTKEENGGYAYLILKSHKSGKTLNTTVYISKPSKRKRLDIPTSEMVKDLEEIIGNLKEDERISDILDIEQLENILKDIKKKSAQIKK